MPPLMHKISLLSPSHRCASAAGCVAVTCVPWVRMTWKGDGVSPKKKLTLCHQSGSSGGPSKKGCAGRYVAIYHTVRRPLWWRGCAEGGSKRSVTGILWMSPLADADITDDVQSQSGMIHSV